MQCKIIAFLTPFLFYLFSLPLYADQLIIEPEMGREPILNMIDHAHQSIEVVMYGFTDKILLDKLIQQKIKGRTIKAMIERKPYQAEHENIKTISVLKLHHIPWVGSLPFLRLIHQKTLIADHQKAMVMTFNFTNAAFRNERNFALIIDEPGGVKEIESIFSADWNGISPQNSSSRLYLSPTDSRKKLLIFLKQAKFTLKIYAQNVSDYQTIGALAKAARNGVNIQLLTSNRIRKKQENYLSHAGIIIHYTKQLNIHAKVFIIDEEKAVLGSLNLTRSSFDDNRELSVLTQDPSVVKSLLRTFNKDWDNATLSPDKYLRF